MRPVQPVQLLRANFLRPVQLARLVQVWYPSGMDLLDALREKYPRPYLLRKALLEKGYPVSMATVCRWYLGKSWVSAATPFLQKLVAQ